MMTKPCHGERQTVFVAPFGNKIEIVVRVDRALAPASVSRIGVEDIAFRVLVKDADARSFRARKLDEIEVVLDLAPGDLLRGERSLEVIVEIRAERRDPIELPSHSLFEGFNLGRGRS